MKRKVILLLDNSKASQEAAKILKESNIEYTQLLSINERLPCIISPDHEYPFEGIGGVRLFVRDAKINK
ncbi:MAG: hypothetical protein WC306_01720 [Candidatus Paceibacterota bacterium]|jgi:hypothetical protein